MTGSQHAPDLPESLQRTAGPGGLPILTVRDEQLGFLDVFLHGAHVTHWAPPGVDPVLWLSPLSAYRDDAAIRGGVPICFPWFGGGPDDDLKPAHGYARLREWSLRSATEGDGRLEVVLALEGESLAPTYRVVVDQPADGSTATLTLALEVRNDGAEPQTYEAALHTYLSVSDIAQVAVEGLSGAQYLDRLGGPEPVRQEEDVIRFAGETDRIYLGTDADVVVRDPGLDRRVAVRRSAPGSTIVWNPWEGKASRMADLEGWTQFVCVETANVRSDAVTLAPGESHTLAATLEVLPGA